ncbi:glia-derived nexin-like [Uranotaenia lowii]|uniref:glia-derived nexin-like n=1 Tax=Uranotaenia lowii TaxID=190385 RepID=UPI002479953D|nr:glia-derived nexin-like [Uranotaenia lowii]
MMSLGIDDKASHFLFNLFLLFCLREPDQNCIMCPVMVYAMLATMYQLADGNAAYELSSFLELAYGIHQIRSDIREMWLKYEHYAINTTSKLFYSKEIELRANQSTVVSVPTRAIDFNDGPPVADVVNHWVSRVTNGNIHSVLEPNEDILNTNFLLLNTVYLSASWQAPFTSRNTGKAVFHFENGIHEIDMMQKRDNYLFGHYRGCHVLELPYENGTDLSLLLVMPKEYTALKHIIPMLDASWISQIDGTLGYTNFILYIPKFTTIKTISTKPLLKHMQVQEIFKPGAFDISTRTALQLLDVRHCVHVDVAEKGTRTASAKGMFLDELSDPAPVRQFCVSRPFLYVIRKQSTKEIYFIGHYSHYED